MPTDIIDMVTRQRWVPPQQEIAEAETIDSTLEISIGVDDAHTRDLLDLLEKMAQMARTGRVGGFLLIAQDNLTGYFMQEIKLPAEMDRHELFGFVGLLDTLKMELGENSSMAPTINLDGNVVDPYEEYCS